MHALLLCWWLAFAIHNVCGSSVTVLVMSKINDPARRKAIRETWAAGHNNIKFVVGQPCAKTAEWHCKAAASRYPPPPELTAIRREHAKHKDVYMASKPESYRGLPGKLKDAYAAALNESTATTWFCKIDDDAFVRVSDLEQYLESLGQNPPIPPVAQPTVVGFIAKGWGVHRSGKWQELDYKPSRYPPFPVGSYGHCVTRPVAQYIVDNRQDLFDYQGEDVSVGIWLHNAPLHVRWVSTPKFANHGNCAAPGLVAIGHDVAAQSMKKCQGLI